MTVRQPEVKEPGSNIFSRSYNRALATVQAGSWSLEKVLFILAILLYLVTHLVKLDSFPINFVPDEANQTMLAADMIRDHGLNYDQEFLPTYFVNGNQYELSTSVYLQVLPTILFHRSIDVTRGTAAMATLLAAISIGLTLKRMFKSRYYWTGVLLLIITPAWFMFSRTAFDTSLSTSFFAAFIYFYLVYRTSSPKALYPAVVMGALCFYSFSPAQVVMVVTGLFLLISDLRYHWQNREIFLWAIGLGMLLALPYVRYLILHSSGNYNHLVTLRSYWVSDLTLLEKLKQFGGNWLKGLDPYYWFIPNNMDLVRHIMKGYGHLFRLSFPFLVFGVILSIRFIKSSPYRALLLLLVATPAGSALVEPNITRQLFLIIPAVLLSCVALDNILRWLEKKRVSFVLISLILFVSMAGSGGYMLYDSLTNGPTWFSDYGLYGMQYGAKQLYGEVKTWLSLHPGGNLIVTPSSANGTEVARFFFNDPLPFEINNIDGYLHEYKPIKPGTEFVVNPDEYRRIIESSKFSNLQVDKTIYFPNGTPGFYFIHLDYVENIQQVFATEAALRSMLLEGDATLPDGTPVTVQYSLLDSGQLSYLFDEVSNTVTRTKYATPFNINITFLSPYLINGVSLHVDSNPTRLIVDGQSLSSDTPLHFEQQKGESSDPGDMVIDFGSTCQVTQIKIQVFSIKDNEPCPVQVWEITFQTP